MPERDINQTERAAFAEGFAGITLKELSEMPDVELAKWQADWKPGTDKYILAEKEWQRRIAMRELGEQFRLDERLANGNRWWSIAAAGIGVIGTLLGVWLGKQSEPITQAAGQQESTAISTALPQPQPSSTIATSAAKTTTPSPAKKTP